MDYEMDIDPATLTQFCVDIKKKSLLDLENWFQQNEKFLKKSRPILPEDDFSLL